MGWLEGVTQLLGKYGEYDIAKRGVNDQQAQAAAIMASQQAQARANANNMTPLLLMGGLGLLVVLMVK